MKSLFKWVRTIKNRFSTQKPKDVVYIEHISFSLRFISQLSVDFLVSIIHTIHQNHFVHATAYTHILFAASRLNE